MFQLFKRSRTSEMRRRGMRHQLGVDRLETRSLMSAAALVANELVITGTKGDDVLEISAPQAPPVTISPATAQDSAAWARFVGPPVRVPVASSSERTPGLEAAGSSSASAAGIRSPVVLVYNNGVEIGAFATDSFKSVQIYGFGGNDTIVVSALLSVPVLMDGGVGNDTLVAGNNSTIALGRDGNDLIVGNNARDILIGGDGADTIRAYGGDDILIAGRTRYDDNQQALFALLETWNSTESYLSRVESITAGIDLRLDGPRGFVVYDKSLDVLEGGSGSDWFFAGPNTKIIDWSRGERVQ